MERYLIVVSNINHRRAVTQLRCSTHNLNVEKGRHRGIERSQRFCNCCQNVLEDEAHFMFVCPLYDDLRRKFLPSYCIDNHVSMLCKMKMLFNSTDDNVIINTSRYIYFAFKRHVLFVTT